MLNTATTYLALLQDEDIDIKAIALDKINELVDDYWAEISDSLKNLENLNKSNQIPEKKDLLALIISKIYYNLEDYDSAIEWALEAGTRFNIHENSQYVNTIRKKILEKYISTRRENFYNEQKVKIDDRINGIVESLFKKCLERKEVKQAIGLSLDSYDLDRVNFIY